MKLFNRCDICAKECFCDQCMWYEGPRAYADNTILFKDLFVVSPSKLINKKLGLGKEFAEGFLEGVKRERVIQESNGNKRTGNEGIRKTRYGKYRR